MSILSAEAAASFIAATAKKADEARTARELAAVWKSRNAEEDRLAQAAYDQRVKEAFKDFDAAVLPLLEVLDNLPDRKGNSFLIRLEKGLNYNYKSKAEEPVLNLWMVYGESTNTRTKESKPVAHAIEMPRSLDSPVNDAFVKLDNKPILRIWIGADSQTRETKITAATYREEAEYKEQPGLVPPLGYWITQDYDHNEIEVKSVGGLPSQIGAWVAEVAPDRLSEINAALKAKAAKQPVFVKGFGR